MADITDLIKISQLSTAPDVLSGSEEIPANQAGITYKLLSRMFILPADPIITYAGFQGTAPGSKLLVGVGGIHVDTTLDEVQISSTGPVLDSSVTAALAVSQENWNPTGWVGGLRKNRLRVTPSSGTLLGGLDASDVEDGQIIAVPNDSPTDLLRFGHDSAGSLAANRFLCPGGATYSIAPYQVALLINMGSTGWRLI